MNGKLLVIAGAATMGLNRRCWRKRGEGRNGAGDGIRTHDSLLGKQILYH